MLAMLNALKVVKDSNQIDIATTVAAIVNKYKIADVESVDEPLVSTKGTKWMSNDFTPKLHKRREYAKRDK